VEISAGLDHTCGRDFFGDVYCWGANLRGQAGDSGAITTSSLRLAPTRALVSDVALISAGMFHTCVHTSSAKTMCWGANDFGELGSTPAGLSTRTSTPTAVQW